MEVNWTIVPAHRSSARTQEYTSLLRHADALLEKGERFKEASLLNEALDVLDRLASFLNAQLLPGDVFALDPEVLDLYCHPLATSEVPVFIAATRSHMQLLEYQASEEGIGRLKTWMAPLRGTPLGVALQPVGYIGSFEVIALTRDGEILREYRLALSAGSKATVVASHQTETSQMTSLGKCTRGVMPPVQVEVRRSVGEEERPYFHLRIRRDAASAWSLVHVAGHPLQNPIFDGMNLYFTARASQIMVLRDPFSDEHGQPEGVITLETPSPIQALLVNPSSDEAHLIAATADGSLFGIDSSAKKLVWKFDTGQSLTSATLYSSDTSHILVVGTPEGLLEFFHPVQTTHIWDRISLLLNHLALPPEVLFDRVTHAGSGPLVPWRSPTDLVEPPSSYLRPHERRYLRLLAVDQLIRTESQRTSTLERIKHGIVESFVSAFHSVDRGDRFATEVIRFLSFQFQKLVAEHETAQPSSLDFETRRFHPILGVLFSALESLILLAHGDARRRLERLVRQLQESWMAGDRFEAYRAEYARSLTHVQLTSHSLRRSAKEHLKDSEQADSIDRRFAGLLRALSATWRRFLAPLNRVASIQGISQAVPLTSMSGLANMRLAMPPLVEAGDPPGDSGGAVLDEAWKAEGTAKTDRLWLIGLNAMGLQIFCISAEEPVPAAVAFKELELGSRLALGPMPELGGDVLVVAHADRLTTFKVMFSNEIPELLDAGIADLELDEPVTALEILKVPGPEGDAQFIPALAVGQADGRFRLFLLAVVQGVDGGIAEFAWQPILDFFRPTPVHHVAIHPWPKQPALLISADILRIFHAVRLENGRLEGVLEDVELEAAVTALTVARPPSRRATQERPVLVVGLANGLVQAFQPALAPNQGPELCWLYRAPQVITNLAYLSDHTGGWFVAAADNGTLHLLRYGEPHFQVAVERYPFDLTPVRLPGSDQPHLLVSSPAMAVSLLEVTGEDGMRDTQSLIARIEKISTTMRLLRKLERATDPVLLALAFHILSSHPIEELIEFADRHQAVALFNETVATIMVATLLRRGQESEAARKHAYGFIRQAFSQNEVPTAVKVNLLLNLGGCLDRMGDEEVDLILAPLGVEDPVVARAYIEMLEHLWGRFAGTVDDVVWWQGIHRLALNSDTVDRRHLLPVVGTFARKLLALGRDNVLEALRSLRVLEESGLSLARPVCNALSAPYVLSDSLVLECVSQYGKLLRADSPEALHTALKERRDMLERLIPVVPQAQVAVRVYEDILETFAYSDYEQYSRFLVDSIEFMPRARVDQADNASILDAFSEVRSKLTAMVPHLSKDVSPSKQFQDRVQTLLAQVQILLDVVRRWNTGGSLEQHIVAAVVGRWRERILLPEVRRLQESVELMVQELRVVLPDDGGLAEVLARINNLGGRPLEGVRVGLSASPRNAYLWEGNSEWCQGPIHYGQAIEYRTEILLEQGVDTVTMHFELMYMDHAQEIRRSIQATTAVIREEGAASSTDIFNWRAGMPSSFEALRLSLLKVEAGKVLLVMAEDVREREQLMTDLSESLRERVDVSRRAVIDLDLPVMLEGPPRAEVDEFPHWWIPDRLARLLHEQNVLPVIPERLELRADPKMALDRFLSRALESSDEIFFVLKRASRAFLAYPPRTIELMTHVILALVQHASRHIRVLVSGDYGIAVRISLEPSPLLGQVELFDVDRPFPVVSLRSREEHLRRLETLLRSSTVNLSELVRNKLVAYSGWSLPTLRKLVQRLEAIRSEPWLQWQRGERDAQGEPEELAGFLRHALPAISRPLKERLRVLPFFHRLALVAVASARMNIPKRELREGQVLARDLWTSVRAKGNRPKRLYAEHTVLLEGDVHYLQVTVGDVQGRIEVGMFRTLDFSVSLSHLLAIVGVQKLLRDLEMLGLVRHTTGGNGPAWWISSPVLRQWLVTAHPFEQGEEGNLRHRLAEDVNVAEIMPIWVLIELQSRLSRDGQLSDLLEFFGLMSAGDRKKSITEPDLRRWERLITIARRLMTWGNHPSAETQKMPVQEWAAFFSCKVVDREFPLEAGIFATMVDLTPLRIPRLTHAVVFGVVGDLTPLRLDAMREVVRRISMDVETDSAELTTGALGFVMLPVVNASKTPELRFPDLRGSDERTNLGQRLLPMHDRELVRMALSTDSRRSLLDLVARGGFQFQHLSPYQPIGPLKGRAMDVLFVGRDDEIDDVLRHPDRHFAIVGSRRIGKTSLLLKLKREIQHHLGERSRVLYLDCATMTPAQVWRAIAEGIGVQLVPGEDAHASLSRQINQLRLPVVLLLDEIDGVYGTSDQARGVDAERLMWGLRSLSTGGVVRLVLAGYVKIYEQRLDVRSAFHNFTTFRKLSALGREAARTLVKSPMSLLDLHFASESLVDSVIERTYRVPWIIQMFCNQLIIKLDERLVRSRRFDRRILREDVDGVSVQIEEQLFTHFTSPRVTSTAEQILLLTMVEAGVNTFTEEELRKQLEQRHGEAFWDRFPYEDLPRAMDNLTLTLALTVEGGVYSFPLDMYPTVIRSRLGDVRPRLERLCQIFSRAGTS